MPTVDKMAKVIIKKMASLRELKNSTKASPNSLKLKGFEASACSVMTPLLQIVEAPFILQGADLHCQDDCGVSNPFIQEITIDNRGVISLT